MVKRILNTTTGKYYKLRQKTTANGTVGQIMGLWSPKRTTAPTMSKRETGGMKWMDDIPHKRYPMGTIVRCMITQKIRKGYQYAMKRGHKNGYIYAVIIDYTTQDNLSVVESSSLEEILNWKENIMRLEGNIWYRDTMDVQVLVD